MGGIKMIRIVAAMATMASTLALAETDPTPAATDPKNCAAAVSAGKILDAEIDRCLLADGLRLEVHGVSPTHGTAVVAFRDPANFFLYRLFPIISKDKLVKAEIMKLKRHDIILVKGELADLEQRYKVTITLEGDPALPPGDGKIDFLKEGTKPEPAH